MSDIKLFKISSSTVEELKGTSVNLEKSLQTMIERNLEAFLGVRFLASEFSTGKVHGGRIDTLGIDEDNCPVIIEYKRTSDENVINQGLFYLDWLFDHRGDFKDLVVKKLGAAVAEEIDWSAPRLICIASDFTKYDSHAILQIDRNIDLLRYRRFGSDLLMFDLVKKATGGSVSLSEHDKTGKSSGNASSYRTVEESLSGASSQIRDLFEALKEYCLGLGDDVEFRTLKYYFAFRHLKNFACVEISQKRMGVYLTIDPDTVDLQEGFTRDVRNIGHWGTGKLEITVTCAEELEAAKPLIVRSYNNS